MSQVGVEQPGKPVEMARPESGIGIIVPPPARKAIIDKTATFVAQKGRHVEEEILSRPQGQNASNFTFLLEDNPFHPYYLAKLEELRGGAPAETPSVQPPPSSSPAENSLANSNTQKSSTVVSAPLIRASNLIEAMKASSKKKGQELPAFEFMLEKPADASYEEIQLIKLTAQFAATDGKRFESDIFQKERGNEEFGFLHVSHSYHAYYVDLVRCYKRLLEGIPQWLVDLALSENVLLERAVRRFEHRREDALKRVETDEKRELERLARMEIDWHDFVIVETIRFDDEEGELNPTQTEMQQHITQAAQAMRQAASSNGVADSDDFVGEVRKNYSVEPVRATVSAQMVTLPDGRTVPVSQMNEHMKVNLLDPKWREYQDKFENRQKETNMAEAGSMEKNLRRLAGARPDVFGGERDEADRRMEERKRRKENEVVAWDGNMLNADNVKAAAASMAQSHHSSSIPSIYTSTPQIPSLPLPPGSFRPSPPPVMAPPSLAPPPPTLGAPVAQTAFQPDAKRQKLGVSQAMEDEFVFTVVVPAGGPGGLGPTDLSITVKKAATINELKEGISRQLSNVALGKFQVKTQDGKFPKNADALTSLDPSSALEIKWKLK